MKVCYNCFLPSLIDEQLFDEGALDMKRYITNEARSAKLVMITMMLEM